jgi:outer membrane protein assembly factor BamB
VASYVSSPVIVGEVVYVQDLLSNVRAIDLKSGALEWEKSFYSTTTGPNGVFVASNKVYGATPDEAFALDRSSGRKVWSTHLTERDSERIAMAPGYHEGMVYLSTSPGSFEGGERGTLWALDARTGKKIWSFETVPKNLWGNPKVNFGGGLTRPPAFDERGFMYFGVGGPGPLPGTRHRPWGSSRPGPNLYTDSVVKLDAKTGKLEWHYQLTPHAICVWDLQESPLLLEADGRRLVIAAGKAGIVVALDQRTGKPVWRRPVGIHNGHDRDGVRTIANGYSGIDLPATVYPGSYGGVTAPMSTDGDTVFVPLLNHSTTLVSQSFAEQSESYSGELLALEAATGKIRWRRRLDPVTFGATSTTGDLVFATTIDGAVHAFDTGSGREEWKVALPAGINGGLAFSEDTLVVPAALGSKPRVTAYRLEG